MSEIPRPSGPHCATCRCALLFGTAAGREVESAHDGTSGERPEVTMMQWERHDQQKEGNSRTAEVQNAEAVRSRGVEDIGAAEDAEREVSGAESGTEEFDAREGDAQHGDVTVQMLSAARNANRAEIPRRRAGHPHPERPIRSHCGGERLGDGCATDSETMSSRAKDDHAMCSAIAIAIAAADSAAATDVAVRDDNSDNDGNDGNSDDEDDERNNNAPVDLEDSTNVMDLDDDEENHIDHNDEHMSVGYTDTADIIDHHARGPGPFVSFDIDNNIPQAGMIERSASMCSTPDTVCSTPDTAFSHLASSASSPVSLPSESVCQPVSGGGPDFYSWLAARAAARGIALPLRKTITTWTAYAHSATVDSVLETLRAWLCAARDHRQPQQQQCRASLQRLELPELISSPSIPSIGDDLALAVRTFRICERATAIGGQAVLCRRLCYANLYRLNERAREQSVRGSSSRMQLFDLCYPEFANPDGSLTNLSTEGHKALGRLSRDIHFGGAICRFADRFSCPEAALLLQPAIPDRFLRKLTAAQLDVWADMVCRVAKPTSQVLRCLWKTTAMIVNQAVDLQSYGFLFEHVGFDGSKLFDLFDLENKGPAQSSVEHLLTPVPLERLYRSDLQTNRPVRSTFEHSPGLPPASNESLTCFRSFQPMQAVGQADLCATEHVGAERHATGLLDRGLSSSVFGEQTENNNYQGEPDAELPSSVFGGTGIWTENDIFRQALGVSMDY